MLFVCCCFLAFSVGALRVGFLNAFLFVVFLDPFLEGEVEKREGKGG